jgi:phage-related protein
VSKPLAWLGVAVKTPPMTESERVEIGALLRRLQEGETLPMPYSRPMSSVGANGHELRVKAWRVLYAVRSDAIVVLEIFLKKSRTTPKAVIARAAERLRQFDEEH